MFKLHYRPHNYPTTAWRVWRSDWASDQFETFTQQNFEALLDIATKFSIPMVDQEDLDAADNNTTATPTPPPTIAEQLRDLLTSGAFVTDATDEEHVAIYLSDNSVLILNAKTDIAWTTSKGGAADTLLTYKRAVAACHSIAEFDVLIKERAELLAQSAQPA